MSRIAALYYSLPVRTNIYVTVQIYNVVCCIHTLWNIFYKVGIIYLKNSTKLNVFNYLHEPKHTRNMFSSLFSNHLSFLCTPVKHLFFFVSGYKPCASRGADAEQTRRDSTKSLGPSISVRLQRDVRCTGAHRAQWTPLLQRA